MVQGNSARRKELAAGRRQDRKDEIERKKAGVTRATPAEARARLLDYSARRDARGSMIAWSAAPASRGAPAWCAAFVRDGACPRGRRCKLRHATSLAHLARPAPRHAAFAEALPALARARLEAAPAGGKLVYDGKIRSARREASPLYFVECEGALVFDAEVTSLPVPFSPFSLLHVSNMHLTGSTLLRALGREHRRDDDARGAGSEGQGCQRGRHS